MASKAEQIKADYDRKLAESEAEDKIASIIPDGGRIHVHSLYGTVASVKYGDTFGGKPCTWDDAKRLVRALPPVGLTMVRDGCLSFRTTEHVESLPEGRKARWNEEVPCSPVLAHIEGFQGPTLSLEWNARVEGIGVVRVTVVMGPMWNHRGIGTYSAKRVEFQGGFRYERAKFTPANDLHSIHAAEENGAAVQLESPIVWASGGQEYPNRISLYFVDLGADLDAANVGRVIVDGLASLASKGGK
jgi:hypothetical protein